MQPGKASPWRFRALLILMNVAGLLWIRHELTSAPMPRMRVLAALPARDVDRTDRFTLVFDEPLPMKAAMGSPLTWSPFVINPRPAGQWIWSQPDRLEYVLDKPLSPGRVFTISAAPDLETRMSRTIAGESEFRFQTRPLELAKCEVKTADHQHVNIQLSFNQPVSPDDLLEHLAVTDRKHGHSLEPVCMTREPSERLVVRLRRPDSSRLLIRLDGKLTGSQGELALGSPFAREMTVDEAFRLRDADVDQPGLERLVSVYLEFSRDLDTKQPLPQVLITPEVDGLRVSYAPWSHRLRLKAPFRCGQPYAAKVAADAMSRDGQALGESQSVSFTIPDRYPAIRFPHDAGILSPNGNLTLDLSVVNVGGLKLSASRVHANNLLAHLRDDDADATSRTKVKKTIPLNLKENDPAKVALDLKDLIAGARGIYHVHAGATDQNWTDDSAVVAVTDLAITTKQQRDGLLVWITSLSTANPVPGAKVSAVSYNNQTLASAITDARGIARLRVPENHPDGQAWVIVAELGDDLSYLRPDRHLWVLDDVDQSGREIPKTYDVMLYTERGVYRPGDTIHLTGIVRDAIGQVPPAFPLAVKVTRPDGRVVAELPAKHDPKKQGLFQLDFPTDDKGQTGPYRFAVTLPGAKDVLGQTTALVEAFMPIRIELSAEPTKDRFGPADKVEIRSEARYLFGKPAAGLSLSASGAFRREPFRSAKFPSFSFKPPNEGQRIDIKAPKQTTSDNGKALLTVSPPNDKPPGTWRGALALTIHETGGRSVSKNLSLIVDTADRHIGLRLPTGRVAPTHTPINVEWVQVNGADEPAKPNPAAFELARVEFDTTLQKVDGRTVWKSVERLIPTAKGKIADQSSPEPKGTLPITCPDPGLYRLRVSDTTSGSSTELEFYACQDASDAQSVALDRPEQLEIILDKDRYAPGAKAKALVRSPFAGRMLLTVETDHVIDAKVVELTKNTAEVELDVSKEIRGGAFVAATVIRKVDPNDKKWLPHRAMGLARLLTDHRDRKLPLTIAAPDKAEPGQEIAITVQTDMPSDPNRPGCLHLWAVDEGILLTTSYPTPDPIRHFFGPRRASVLSADLFAELMPDHKRPADMTRIGAGGWDDQPDALRRNPVPTRRADPAVVWQTVSEIKPDGIAYAKMTMPDLTGQMRLMAVAVEGDRFGAAQRALTLTAPLLVETSWPRFAAPGDEFQVPVKVFNSTDAPMTVKLDLRLDGPLECTPPESFKGITVEPGKPLTAWIPVKAKDLGPVSACLEAFGTSTGSGSPVAKAKAHLTVRPASTLHTESKLIKLEAGKSITIEPSDDFLPGSTETSIRLAKIPTIHLQPSLQELLDYPYGCAEQTTSQLYVVLNAPDLLKSDSPDDVRVRNVADMVNAGIARLWSMQTRSGGLGYWPGATSADEWATVYAAGFLAQAKQKGYQVDPQFVKDLLTYVEKLLRRSGDEKTDVNTRAEICRVLAAFDRPQQGWMARLSEQADQLDIAGRAHLAMAWMAIGRKDRAKAVLKDDSLSQTIATTTGGRLTSQVRQEGVLLDAMLELDPTHPWVPALVERLEKARVNGKWHSTLENATALAALTRYQALAKNDAAFQGTVHVGNETTASFDHTKPRTIVVPTGKDDGIRIESSGKGNIYATLTTRGLRRQTSTAGYDRQLRVRRTWTDAKGKPVELTKLQTGDLVCVEIKIDSPARKDRQPIENVAVVDALPGGMEVENPRLSTSAQTGGRGTANVPDRVEFLDDRVVLFCSVGSNPSVFRYALRVVTPGSFIAPPVEASCMYDAAFASVSGGGQIAVTQ
ncbi:MAG: alpha-2-macroglobulin family protein [Phycisphaerae bacterium]|nr:alpha-2-macroglobulin family protein [Phycisphaerae bacterium]